MHHVKTIEVQVATIRDVNRSSFRHQNVEHIDVVQLAVGNVNEGLNVAARVEQRVHLDRCLGRANGAHGNTDRHRSMVVESSA